MDNEKTFEEKMDDLKNSALPLRFVPSMVSTESIDQMIRAHQLKYIENVIEVEEEYKLVETNLKDFMAYEDSIQEAALAAFENSKRDPEYFSKPGVDMGLYKPVLILGNIEAKKNEVKIKNWKVEHYSRLITTLRDFRFYAGKELIDSSEVTIAKAIVNLFKKIIRK